LQCLLMQDTSQSRNDDSLTDFARVIMIMYLKEECEEKRQQQVGRRIAFLWIY
jgi:hypothetical protein